MYLWNIFEKIALWFLHLFFTLLHKEVNKEVENSFLQFIKFGIVGLSNTLIAYFINIGVLLILSTKNVKWDYIAGNIVAFILSVLWSFYWNNKYVFIKRENEKRSVLKTLMKTYTAYALTGLVLNNLLSMLWINILGISKYIAPIINLTISVPLNYIINKFWAFKTEEKNEN